MGKEFNNVLDECLERLLARGETIEQCLQGYPEQVSELKPLLETALAVKKASDIQPRAEFKTSARYQFHSALEEAASQRSRPTFGWLPRWATVVTMVLGLLLVGSGTVAAAGYSMPDSPLYPVKLATERVRLALTRSNIDKAELYAMLADKRISELTYLTNKDRPKLIEQTAQRLNNHMMVMADLPLVEVTPETESPARREPAMLAPPAEAPATEDAAPVPEVKAVKPEAGGNGKGNGKPTPLDERGELRALLMANATRHQATLRSLLEKVPASARPAIMEAIAVSESSYEKLLQALD